MSYKRKFTSRLHWKKDPQKQTKGPILEIKIMLPRLDIAFVQDLNGTEKPFPKYPSELGDLVQAEVDAALVEHFGQAA